MIHNQRWYKELINHDRKLMVFYYIGQIYASDWVQYMISKHILYSASIIRKINESEKRDEEELEKAHKEGCLEWLESIPLIVKDSQIDILFQDLIDSEDEQQNYTHLQEEKVNISTVCNKILHDKDWILWCDAKTHKIQGFRVSSEKGSRQYFISIPQWRICIQQCFAFYDKPN